MPNINVQSWTFDAPTGVYKSNALSQRVLQAAIANTQFMAYVMAEPNYGKGKGETITIPRFSNVAIPTSGRIGEFDDIPEDKVAQSTKGITVTEWGRSLPYSTFNRDLSPLDLPSNLRTALEKQMKLVLDSAAAAAFKTTLTKYVPDGIASGTITTNGVAGATAASNLNFFHIEKIRDYATETLVMDMADYTLIGATKAMRGVKQDPKFEVWNAPQNMQAKVTGTIGKIESVTVIECNNAGSAASGRSLRNDLGTAGVLGEALFFSGKPVSMAVVEQPHVLVAQLDPYARTYGIAWYGIMEYAATWAADSAASGEADIIHVTSL